MKGHNHFSHPHTLTFHQNSEGAQHTCTGCNFPCTDTAVYACHECKFFLHDQCFDASRSLIHPSHPDHPLSLFPSPTYTSGSFVCSSCNKIGSGFCFCCPACDFDLHIHCAYNTLSPKPSANPPPNQIASLAKSAHGKDLAHELSLLHVNPNPSSSSTTLPSQIKLLKSTPNRQLKCNVCGTSCDSNGTLYRSDISNYDASHALCTNLSKTIGQKDHEHALSSLSESPYPNPSLNPNPLPSHIKLKSHHHMLKYLTKPPNPSSTRSCDVCGTRCDSNRALYRCDICDYDAHVSCINLPKTIRRGDHDHALSLLYLKPHPKSECDVCRRRIAQKHCMYYCTSGCDYGTHVKCVSREVSDDEMTFDWETNLIYSAFMIGHIIDHC